MLSRCNNCQANKSGQDWGPVADIFYRASDIVYALNTEDELQVLDTLSIVGRDTGEAIVVAVALNFTSGHGRETGEVELELVFLV